MQKTLRSLIRSLLKKTAALLLSILICNGQGLLVQSTLGVITMGLPQEAYADGASSQLGENTSSKYSPAHPFLPYLLNNIKDSPIPGIQTDNTLGRGELINIDASATGTLNNNSAIIATTEKGSQVKINAGQINNTTDKRTDTYQDGKYKKEVTTLGATAMIASAGDLSINTSGDLNLKGSVISGQQGHVDLKVGGKINATVVEDSFKQSSSQTTKGIFSSSTQEEETLKVRNLGSSITGRSVTATANSMSLQNTSIVSQRDATLTARDKIELTTALDQDSRYVKDSKKNRPPA